ncbi:FAD/NAD(P)-binding oxidoreductase [Comamonas sp. Y6]|uniref:FAD/NAD(P)-binding oxidoreductase n=1 Tax=Comamonas resistens TaxID=3046670 RepID=A0ABY8STC2_9BURK|nr:FAD/NAD(P)-binding oxidoreductase [Comamonas resistens]MDL5035765.1 FAD/NAD(P)-binding oxidoreductase [Comamonas resistens]WHS65179.1 FAD/NAD(P)-binding oxidoreductase [Comamonas resistens]HBP0979036.1 NAD(P)/FAD-dependent oxidoreductase [Pseudomonas aeruginosa]
MKNEKNLTGDTALQRSIDRRRALLMLGAAGTAGAMLQTTLARAADRTRTKARIVIAGAGAAGLTAASRLAAMLDGAQITLIDARKEHFYQPGFTLVGSGIKPMNYVTSSTTDYVPEEVELVQERVAEFDPEGNRIVTESGKAYPYDFLIVATGMKLEYGLIEGMDEKLIGQSGIGSIYHSPSGALATWQAMSAFADRGGRGVFTRPATEMKCAGAPLKYTFVTEDYLTRRGQRGKAEVVYNSNNKVLFSVPIVSEKVRMLFQERGIQVNHERVLKAIDPGRRIATFSTPEGAEEQNYDFLHVIPPMRAPEVIRNSPLPWQTGAWAAEGWMEVDKGTLRHVRYRNVFGVGDIAGVPKGKTAASVKWQVPVAVDHLVAEIAGKQSDAVYTGYTSCPMITRLGQAMLVEFDYQNNLVPSFPGVIAPLEELWVSWVMKTMALKPTYISMLRGHA